MASKHPLPVSGPSTPIVASSSRRQPMRQARTNPARKNAASTKLGGRGTLPNGTTHTAPSTQPPAKFYPALTAFTDAVDALPSETIRHFTLLREVDAKAYSPEAALRTLIDAAQSLPAPEEPYEYDPALETMKRLDELQRRRDELTSQSEIIHLHELEALQSAELAAGSKNILGHPETRRARCLQIRTQITEILVTLDEKIHVITTAYEALQKHLQRIDHAYAYVQHEIPDLYRLGSTEHWAYKEPVKKGTLAAQARAAERAQREAEERHSAQQREIETSNTRTETRREALLRQKAAQAAQAVVNNNNNDEDEQTRETGVQQVVQQPQQQLPAKKLHGNSKARKEQEALASAKRMAEHQSANGGGGLVPAAAAAAATTAVVPQQKRRKTTKETKDTAGATAEKTPVVGTGTKGLGSPRAGTPASTSKRGGKTGSGTGAGRGGRSRNLGGPGASPNLASSPVHPSFPPPATTSVTSVAAAVLAGGAGTGGAKPQPVAETPKAKTARKEKDKDKEKDPVAEDVPVRKEKIPATPERPDFSNREDVVMSGTTTSIPEPKTPPEKSKRKAIPAAPTVTAAAPTPVTATADQRPPQSPRAPSPVRKDTNKEKRKRDDHHAKPRPSTSDGLAAQTQTPAKRGARKRADSHAALHPTRGMKVEEPDEGADADAEDEVEVEEDEPVYCYCQQVSYGEMVACDGENCPKEWFHLDCVGLQQAPRGKAKWYCNECGDSLNRARRLGSRA